MWVRYGSFFVSQYEQMMRPYVILHQCSGGMSSLFTKNMVSVVVVSHRISVLKDLLHTFLCLGCLIRCQYLSSSPVSSSSTAFAESLCDVSEYFGIAYSCGVVGIGFLLGNDSICIMHSCVRVLVRCCCPDGGRVSLLSLSLLSCNINCVL